MLREVIIIVLQKEVKWKYLFFKNHNLFEANIRIII